jgi:DNA polymerase
LPDEVQQCEPFLRAQISIIQPKVIVGLGRVATQALLGRPVPITKVRGQVLKALGIAFVPTYHPSYLLRSPDKKREAWEDLKTVLHIVGREPPPRPPGR